MGLPKIYRKIHNTFTPIGIFTFLFGGGMTMFTSFAPAWLSEGAKNVIAIIGIILMLVSAVAIVVVTIRTPELKAYPSVKTMIGIRKDIWDIYKIEQEHALIAGNKRLSYPMLQRVKNQIQHDWKVQQRVITKPLSLDEAERLMLIMSKGRTKVNQQDLDKMFTAGVALDKLSVGVVSLLSVDKKYIAAKVRLDEEQLHVKKSKKIQELRGLSYALNSSLLSVLYLEPIGNKIAPEYKVPKSLLPLAFDEYMHGRLDGF